MSPIKFFLHELNYIVDALMWPKFGNSGISVREVIITSKNLSRKTTIFEGWSWFKFNNFGLVLGKDLKFYKRGKRVETKRQKVLVANFYVCRRYRRKTGRGAFSTPPLSCIGLRLVFSMMINWFFVKWSNCKWALGLFLDGIIARYFKYVRSREYSTHWNLRGESVLTLLKSEVHSATCPTSQMEFFCKNS